MICTLIPQPRGLTTRRDLIRTSCDTPFLSFLSVHFILRKACAPPDLPSLASGLNPRNPATKEMCIQGKKPPFKPPGMLSVLIIANVWGRHQVLKLVMVGQGPKPQGPRSQVSWNIFDLNYPFIPSSPWGPSCKSEHKDKIWFEKHIIVTNAYTTTAYLIILLIASIYGLLKQRKTLYLYSLIWSSWQSICVIGAILS